MKVTFVIKFLFSYIIFCFCFVGKYYLLNVGYPYMSGYIIRPLKGECYHLLDFNGVVYQEVRRKYLTIDIFEENN